jgi:uncharacterized membrane protein YgdD (TMEM256/DUF423 family)
MSNHLAVARCWIATGATLAGLAVVTGAFAAHGMDQYVVDKFADVPDKVIAGQEFAASWKYLQDFKTAAEYQMYHSLGLLVVGLLALRERKKSLHVAGWSFLIGILLFSGSLYLLVLTGITKLGAITPIGGVAFIVGWIALLRAALAIKSDSLTSKVDDATV